MMIPRTAILQVLLRGDSYGLEIMDRIKADTNRRMSIAEGSVYTVLRELESEGLVKSYQQEGAPSRGGRPRRFYGLTAEGRRAARDDAKAIRSLLQPVEAVG